jgi:chromosome segregation ATPase
MAARPSRNGPRGAGDVSADRESVNARVARGRGEEISRLNARIAELERQLAEARDRAEAAEDQLRAAIGEAVLQIEYLHEKFHETGSGNAVLAHLRAVLSPAPVTGESPPRPAPEEPR